MIIPKMKIKYFEKKLMKNEIAVERHQKKNLFFIHLARELQECLVVFTWEISTFNSLRKCLLKRVSWYDLYLK